MTHGIFAERLFSLQVVAATRYATIVFA